MEPYKAKPMPLDYKIDKEMLRLISEANVKYGESLVNKLLSMFDIVRNICIIAVAALIVVTAFLISNTIKKGGIA